MEKLNFLFNNCYPATFLFLELCKWQATKGFQSCAWKIVQLFFSIFWVYYSQELIYHLKYHFKLQNFVTRLMVLGMCRNCLSWFQDLKLRICLFRTEIYKLFIINDAVLLFSQICPFSFLQLVKVIRGFIDVCSSSTSQLNYWKYETHQYPLTLLVFPVLFNFHLLSAFNSDSVISGMMRLNGSWLFGNVVGFYVFMAVVTAIIASIVVAKTEFNHICCLKWFGVKRPK